MKFQRIKNIREDMELTQQQVADKLNNDIEKDDGNGINRGE